MGTDAPYLFSHGCLANVNIVPVLTPAAAFLQLEGDANANIIVDGGDLTKAASPVALKTGATRGAVRVRS